MKEFQILNLRNNLYFNLKMSKLKRDCTDTEKKALAQCDSCKEEGSSFHRLTLCRRIKVIWDYLFKILRNCGYKFKDVSPANIFFNSFGSQNSFPNLIVLNVKKCIYWSKCNKTQPAVRIIKNNLLRFLSIQLEVYKYGSKKEELNRI